MNRGPREQQRRQACLLVAFASQRRPLNNAGCIACLLFWGGKQRQNAPNEARMHGLPTAHAGALEPLRTSRAAQPYAGTAMPTRPEAEAITA